MQMLHGRILGLVCIALAGLASAQAARFDLDAPAPFVPDNTRTPGMINYHVTQANIAQTICVPGWTSTIRPSTSYTNRLKAQQMRALHLPGKVSEYEEDHLVPLCLGGHPTDHRNLWPEPRDGQWAAKFKDQLEASVCRALCRGVMTLEEGRAIFLRPDWTKEYTEFFNLK